VPRSRCSLKRSCRWARSAWTCAPATRSHARGKPVVPSRRTSDTDEAPFAIANGCACSWGGLWHHGAPRGLLSQLSTGEALIVRHDAVRGVGHLYRRAVGLRATATTRLMSIGWSMTRTSLMPKPRPVRSVRQPGRRQSRRAPDARRRRQLPVQLSDPPELDGAQPGSPARSATWWTKGSSATCRPTRRTADAGSPAQHQHPTRLLRSPGHVTVCRDSSDPPGNRAGVGAASAAARRRCRSPPPVTATAVAARPRQRRPARTATPSTTTAIMVSSITPLLVRSPVRPPARPWHAPRPAHEPTSPTVAVPGRCGPAWPRPAGATTPP
jgi:hypothetical protein